MRDTYSNSIRNDVFLKMSSVESNEVQCNWGNCNVNLRLELAHQFCCQIDNRLTIVTIRHRPSNGCNNSTPTSYTVISFSPIVIVGVFNMCENLLH